MTTHNQVLEITTEPITDENGKESQAIFVACDINDIENAAEFVCDEVAGQFRVAQFLSLPSGAVSLLLITIIGQMSAEDFAETWREKCRQDTLLATFMSKIEQAVVVHGTADGEAVGEASLLS